MDGMADAGLGPGWIDQRFCGTEVVEISKIHSFAAISWMGIFIWLDHEFFCMDYFFLPAQLANLDCGQLGVRLV